MTGARVLAVADWLAMVLVGGLLAPLSTKAEPPEKPNVVLIMADDVGRDVLGCYGGESYRTPNLDRLATSGIRFTHCYSMPVCHPTRVCLLTGRYPMHLGHPAWGTFPRSEEKHTLASLLKRAGYATAIAGKWQLTLLKRDPMQPGRMGFDEWCLFGWHEGPRYYDPLIYQNGRIRSDTQGRYGPDLYVEFLIDFINRHRNQPFFAFYSMALCHAVTDDLKQPVPYGPHGRYDSYAEMVEQMDRHVGRLVDALSELGVSDNTLVLFTGDNGTPKSSIIRAESGRYIKEPVYSLYKGRRVRGGKGSLTDGGTHVPLLALWPAVIQPGQVVDDLIDFSDFLPTLAELGGACLPEEVPLDGHSFAGALTGGPYTPRRWALSEHKERFWVRTVRWKLYNDGRFYDLQTDPDEKRPIKLGQGSEQAQKARAQLQQVVDRLATGFSKTQPRRKREGKSASVQRR